MSEVSMVGLDELFDYKNQLMEDLLTNETILLLLDDDYEVLADPKNLIYKQVFPFEYVPDVVEHGQTFICCEVDIKETLTKTFLLPMIYIWTFTHKSKLRLPEGEGVRTDKLSSEIVKSINGSRLYGLGELNLDSAKRFSPITDYQGRIMTFSAKDFNRLSPTGFPVPSNRKKGR
jgi:hypothetical protein